MTAEREADFFPLALTAPEGAVILEALAVRPFTEVYELIGSLHRQAAVLEAAGADRHTPQIFIFTRGELGYVVRSLGGLSVERAGGVLESINDQLHQLLQLEDMIGMSKQ